MNNFRKKYIKDLQNELEQFLFLCGKTDAHILLSKDTKMYSNKYLRLACICMVFGYKKLFLKIVALAEKNIDKFFKGLESLNGNFEQLEKWVRDFIDNIESVEIQKLTREFWQNRKETIDYRNFEIKQLL